MDIDKSNLISTDNTPYASYQDSENSVEDALKRTAPKVLDYLTLYGSYRPGRASHSHLHIVWHYMLSGFFFIYTSIWLFYGAFNIVTNFYGLWWILYFAYFCKCVAARVSIVEIRKVFKRPNTDVLLDEIKTALPLSQLYFFLTQGVTTVVILLYAILFSDPFGGITYFVGSYIFTGYCSTIVLISAAEARLAKSLVSRMISLASKGNLTRDIYATEKAKVVDIAEKSFWINGLLVLSTIMDTICVVVVSIQYRVAVDVKDTPHTVSFLLFVIVVICLADAVFVVMVCPKIVSVNTAAVTLQETLAAARWPIDSLQESDRFDMLHQVSVFPIVFKMGGMHMTKSSLRAQAGAACAAVVLSIVRIVALEAFS